MLFKSIAGAAEAAPVIIRVSKEGDGLRVMIHQKADDLDKGVIPLAITVAGTPEQLDTELPTAITEACGALKSAEPIAEQVRKQTDLAVKNAPPKKKTTAKKAPAAKKPATKKTATTKPKKTPKPAAGKASALLRREKAATDALRNQSVKRLASRPTAEQCVAAYHAYAAAHPGEPIKREPFMKDNPTGRRFERLFGNWEKFVEAAQKAPPADPAGESGETSTAAQAPCGTSANSPGPLSALTDSPNGKAPAGSTAGSASSPDESETAAKPAPAVDPTAEQAAAMGIHANPTGRSVVIKASNIKIAAGIEITAEAGQRINVPGTSAMLRIVDFDDKTIWVERVNLEETEQQTSGATA